MPPFLTLLKSARFVFFTIPDRAANIICRAGFHVPSHLQSESPVWSTASIRSVAAIFSSGPQFEQIRDGAALGSATHFGDLIDFFHVTPARLSEEHQEIMGTGREQVLNEIPLISGYLCFACGHPDDASAAAPLGAKFALGGPFDVAAVGNSNDASLVWLSDPRYRFRPGRGESSVSRSDPYLSLIRSSSSLMMDITRSARFRISSRSSIFRMISVYSLTIFSRSSPVSW